MRRMIAAETTREKPDPAPAWGTPLSADRSKPRSGKKKSSTARPRRPGIVYVARPGHKGIVLGAARTIKDRRTGRHAEMMEFMGRSTCSCR